MDGFCSVENVILRCKDPVEVEVTSSVIYRSKSTSGASLIVSVHTIRCQKRANILYMSEANISIHIL